MVVRSIKLLVISLAVFISAIFLVFAQSHITQAATSTSTTECGTFGDVSTTDPFYAFVKYLACRGIVSGYQGDGLQHCLPVGQTEDTHQTYYRGCNNATRSQLAKILSESAGYTDTPTGQTFVDVPRLDPFYIYVERVHTHGVISGYTGNGQINPCTGQVEATGSAYFRGCNNVTRGQGAKMVTVAAHFTLINPSTATFADVPVGSTFFTYVETLYSHGAISGYRGDGQQHCLPIGQTEDPAKNYYRPCDNLTRNQIAKVTTLAFFNNVYLTPFPTVSPTSGPTPTPDCHLRSQGDADCNGSVANEDYFYYLRAVSGGALPSGVNPDFDGNGHVDNVAQGEHGDRDIIVGNLTQFGTL